MTVCMNDAVSPPSERAAVIAPGLGERRSRLRSRSSSKAQSVPSEVNPRLAA